MKRYLKKIKTYVKNNKNTTLLYVVLLLLTSLSLYSSYGLFKDAADMNLFEGSVGELSPSSGIDIKINYLVENRNDSGVGNGIYVSSWTAPKQNYTYVVSKSTCTNEATFTKTDDNVFSISTATTTVCDFYFDADTISESTDIDIIIMMENSTQTGYESASRYTISGLKYLGYELNSEKTKCTNDATISLDDTDNTFTVESGGVTVCTAYFDKIEE